ncbi:MFS transporter [Sorangium cellulosum]|uniref:MFS transporter n=1 Tax=Sorangium cellulosum TaxID=56 RepID=A0A2L0EK84_SORCE|nr:MFS transporter [Sorangium cellulosum]AUX39689.1 MFS transporter [Sorangium cellulosum]
MRLPPRSLRRLGLLTSLYVCQGLPFGFFTQALPVLLRKQGISLEGIGLSALLALPWALKFLWAPLVDRFFFPRLGRRRSWILPLQGLMTVALGLAALREPREGLSPVFIAVLVINLLSATQDIATDGLAVDLLEPGERGWANGIQVAGYRAGMIVGGGALLVLFDRLGWGLTLGAMALAVALLSVPTLLVREAERPGEGARAASVGAIAASFWRRPRAGQVLALIVVYKLGDAFAVGMLRPFLSDLGLSLADIGWLLGTVGFVAGLLGALAGGALVLRLGRRTSLVGFGALQMVSVIGYVYAARAAPGVPLLAALCAFEHFAGGMATAALFTCMMDWTARESAATDYTIQASAMVIATGLAAAASGFSAGRLGYPLHFTLAAGLAALSPAVAYGLFPSARAPGKAALEAAA